MEDVKCESIEPNPCRTSFIEYTFIVSINENLLPVLFDLYSQRV